MILFMFVFMFVLVSVLELELVPALIRIMLKSAVTLVGPSLVVVVAPDRRWLDYSKILYDTRQGSQKNSEGT